MNKRHDRAEVLQTGLDMLAARGYSRLGVDEICKGTGMTKGAFYNAFESKENFLICAMGTYADAMVARIERHLAPDERPAFERLKAFYLGTLGFQTEFEFKGCLVNNLMSELAADHDLVARATAGHFDRFIAAILPAVEAAQSEGSLVKDRPAIDIARLLHLTFFGALAQARSARAVDIGINAMTELLNLLECRE